ncbi:serine hydrolase domain-containing protein [Kineococcus sp. SYSU DK001]|uniref:serine hydrolase domain-containing protein n=1 Tax=Kineococcus sp. SYSU DK001 TaxID=3383122 RepID=UPI003D7E1F02
MTTSTPTRRTALAGLAGLAAAAGTLTGGLASAAAAQPRDEVSAALDALVARGFPGALASLRDADGTVRNYVAGERVPVDGEVRIGSNTKTFTAVALLQLVGEGRLDLDAAVEEHLPNLLRGEGIDGRGISVRQVLQHTSGLPNYTAQWATDPAEFRYRYADPRDLLDTALAMPAEFAPGERWSYSNTNYTVAGLLLQAVTGRPWSEQVHRRVVEPLGLQHTYVPAVGELGYRGEHPEGYLVDADGNRTEFTEFDPSTAWAAGAVIASPSDLNRFTVALLRGGLLDAALLREMRTTVPADDVPGAGYGLGLMSFPLPGGGQGWGHGGDIFGCETRGWATDDGRAVTVAVTSLPVDQAGADAVMEAVATIFARTRP